MTTFNVEINTITHDGKAINTHRKSMDAVLLMATIRGLVKQGELIRIDLRVDGKGSHTGTHVALRAQKQTNETD